MAKIMDFEPGDIISPGNKSIQYEVLGYDKDTNE